MPFASTVGDVGTDADLPQWRRAIESYLTKLTQPGLGFTKAALLWLSALFLVSASCAVFFLIMFWLFN